MTRRIRFVCAEISIPSSSHPGLVPHHYPRFSGASKQCTISVTVPPNSFFRLQATSKGALRTLCSVPLHTNPRAGDWSCIGGFRLPIQPNRNTVRCATLHTEYRMEVFRRISCDLNTGYESIEAAADRQEALIATVACT